MSTNVNNKRDDQQPLKKGEEKRFRSNYNNNRNNIYNKNENNKNENNEKESIFNEPKIKSMFSSFSKKLDEDNDRRERIVKNSRDITIASKRVISLLQRAVWEDKQEILKQSKQNLQPIFNLFGNIIKELDQQEYWKFQKAFTNGVQEYIEAVSFQYYIEFGALIPLDSILIPIKEALNLDSLGQFNISIDDYALGICDLSGELMRYSTGCVTVGKYDECFKICDFIRSMSSGFKKCHLNKDITSKMNTMEESLKKIEKLCFSIRIRKSEFPDQQIKVDINDMIE
ncbi:hypothetical protein DDB_G0284837 [Dictyostelium discoideum AX4]|uniref:Translin-associated protein X n=1 Tax=Dictyostelium discoideum TaxID=44689 RepID=Q54P58_DICDI|nr:hypothetical protein DDB_G0284837 [Dictyostelium discoideum AX4]EAL65071.1 hypothetical protein DDB_G0284837 [Dictyostelium discoideum AX4]|eukprot:XP_638400.1 hypothetical protein DDB_G0284837 [Dictyostelium discoideum AX4]